MAARWRHKPWQRGFLPLLAVLGAVVGILGPVDSTRQAQAQTPSKTLLAVTLSNELLRFNSSTPGQIESSLTIGGMSQPGERLLGIDFRPATGELFGLSSAGRVYIIDQFTALATPVPGSSRISPAVAGTDIGFDFNPVPDRIRVVSNTGQNLRLNPVNGAVVDADLARAGTQLDGPLAFATGDRFRGSTPRIVGAAYTNLTVAGSTMTTNYAIDANRGVLVRQGSLNSAPVSPNSGQLFTVGGLGVATTDQVGFDIAAGTEMAFASLTTPGATSSALYMIDLGTGRATRIGGIGGGEVIQGLAAVP